MAHFNIPIFIPHMGCPNQCVFCNQRSISGCTSFRKEDVKPKIEAALQTIKRGSDVEIAFFGGSFTGIDRDLMIDLLECAEGYVRRGAVSSIRLSTRPDYVSKEILEILSRYSVRVIELGLQSMDDGVLMASKRGHTARQAKEACRMVRAAGFSVVGQMMIGLPGADLETELETAHEIVRLGADYARIYPTVVFYGTPLHEMARNGEYEPLSLRDAVARSAAVLRVFWKNGVPCIRIGLCAGEDFSSDDKVYAGPNHAALGEMVWNELYYEKLTARLSQGGFLGHEIDLHLPQNEISKYVGQRRTNIERLLRETDTRVRKIVGEKNLDEPMPCAVSKGPREEEE